MAETKNPKVLSQVDDGEIRLCAALYAVAERQNDEMIKIFLSNFLQLRVSHERKGRKEIIDLAKGIKELPNSRFGRLGQIFGGPNR